MRCLERNKQTVYYKEFLSVTDGADSDGNYTGDKINSYGTMKSVKLRVSPDRGDTAFEPFGTSIDYDRVMQGGDLSVGIAEDTILWIGVPTTGEHNYIVKRRADDINFVQWAIKRVDVS